jgi:hydroxylamine reductase
MFCFQCEQTEGQTGCTTIGVCGKTPEVAAQQDLLVHSLKQVSRYAHMAREIDPNASDAEVDRFVLSSLFATMTNVNFDPDRMSELIETSVDMRRKAMALYEAACQQGQRQVNTFEVWYYYYM